MSRRESPGEPTEEDIAEFVGTIRREVELCRRRSESTVVWNRDRTAFVRVQPQGSETALTVGSLAAEHHVPTAQVLTALEGGGGYEALLGLISP